MVDFVNGIDSRKGQARLDVRALWQCSGVGPMIPTVFIFAWQHVWEGCSM